MPNNATLRIEGGHRDGTVLTVRGSVNALGPMRPGFCIEVGPFSFSDFPHYFGRKPGNKEQEPKWYSAGGMKYWDRAAAIVQKYLDDWDNGGTVTVISHDGGQDS